MSSKKKPSNYLTSEKKEKYGCTYCLDQKTQSYCTYDECPYEELDDYENFEEYLKENFPDNSFEWLLDYIIINYNK